MANDGLCMFNKFGFCKYLDKCRKRHTKETCEKENCEVNKCGKRHPKTCRYFQEFARCKFGEDCYYKHKQKESNYEVVKELERVKEKLRIIENILEKKAEEIERIIDLEKAVAELQIKQTEVNRDSTINIENSDIEDIHEVVENNLNCDLCDFKSSWKTGLEVHMGRKHKFPPQLDGENTIGDDNMDERYEGSEHYWKTQYLGSAFQSFLDANSIIEESSFSEDQKTNVKIAILEARKEAIGANFKHFPPWDKY